MTRRWPFLAGYEIAGGLWGLYSLGLILPRKQPILPFLFFVAVFGLLVFAGILELRTHRLASRLSIIAQALQVPHIMTAALAFYCYGPARFSFGLTLEDASLSFLADVGGGFRLTFLPDLSTTTLGVNVLPLLVIWYIQRRPKPKTAPRPSPRVVRS
jgi:hypothetical protein